LSLCEGDVEQRRRTERGNAGAGQLQQITPAKVDTGLRRALDSDLLGHACLL
jgi:hypothetical protein